MLLCSASLSTVDIKQGCHAEVVALLERALEKSPDEKGGQTLQERLQQAREGLEKEHSSP